MGIPSIPEDLPFSNWKIVVFSSAKIISCVSFLLSLFVILAFRGFNSFSCIMAFVWVLVQRFGEKVFAII